MEKPKITFTGKSSTLKEYRKKKQKTNTKTKTEKRKKIHPKIYEKSTDTTPSKIWMYFQRGLIWGIIIGIIVGTITIAMYSKLLRFQNIIIVSHSGEVYEDLQQQTHRELEGYLYSVIPKNNIFFLKKSQISNMVYDSTPLARHVTIERRWPNSLRINIEEKERVLIWEHAGQHYDVEREGYIFRKSNLSEIEEMLASDSRKTLIIHDQQKEKTIEAPQRIAEQEFIAFAMEIPNTIEKYTRLEIEKISTPNPTTRELHLLTNQGWILLLDTSRSPELEIKTLNKIVEEKLTKDELEKLEYIDLRVREKTFYKLK